MDAPILSPTRAGQLVGPYVLVRRLGVGGMGEVWMGQRTLRGGVTKTVAIKLLSTERARDPQARQMLRDEGRLAMLLSNSNIVQVFDIGEASEGSEYLVMEWVDGLNLAELSERLRERGETLPLAIIGYIVGELLKALAYAHDLTHAGTRQSIIHRDVSPHNVMLSVCGEVKLMDFGVARMASEDSRTSQVKGKLRYMPPEQLRGETSDPKLDLFAVGAILHELLEGEKFRGDVVDDARLCGMILSGEVGGSSRRREVPIELDRLRNGLLRADPSDRVASARVAHRELERWPGYRDQEFELQDIVRRFVVVEAPRTGFELDARSASASMDTPDESQTEVSRSAAPRDQTERRSGRAASSTALAASPPTPARARAWAIAATLLALILLASVGVTMFESRQPPLPTPLHVELEPLALVPPPRIEIPDRPVLEPPPLELEPEPELFDSESELEPELLENVDAVEPTTLVPARRVSVTLVAPSYKFWVQIEIAGKQITLDKLVAGSASIKLEPGVHEVSYREDPEASWRSAGRVEIVPGEATRLVLERGRARVE